MSGPVLDCIPDYVVDRVFDIVVRFHIVTMVTSQLAFDVLNHLRRMRMGTQIVTKQECVAVVGLARNAHVNMGRSAAGRLVEV